MTSSPTNARDQQFCLRWNNYQSNLTQVFNQLFQTESFVDVTLACEGHSVKAHRLVLAACSPYFMTVLTETPCTHPVVILQGVKWTELKAIVEFIYKGEINICQEQLASLLRVAESLKIRGLADVGGEEAEAVLTSPSASPRMPSQFWAEDAPRKRRRLSEEPRSRSRSRTPTPGPNTPHTPASGGPPEREVLEPIVDHPGGGTLSRGSSSSTSNPPPSLPSPSPVASLASSLSSLAHLHGPMPPPGPPIPHHLAHLPPLSPLSPLLNMHPMSRHHPPEDFEIRPGIAEMIREEERAKLLESTHHWIGNPMADRESSSSVQCLKKEKNLSPMKEALRKFCKSNDSSRYMKNKVKNGSGSTQPKYSSSEHACPNNTSGLKYVCRTKGTSKWTQEDLASALMMVRNGTPIKPAAERFNIPVMTLWRRTRALGLVSSKVQCGFRYSSSRNGGINSFNPLSFHLKSRETDSKSKLNHPQIDENFFKERSPLTESNYQPSEGTPVPKYKSEESSHKENSPDTSSPTSSCPSVTTTEVTDAVASSELEETANSVPADNNSSKVPTKEFLVWLSCLGHTKQLTEVEKDQMHFTANSVKSKT